MDMEHFVITLNTIKRTGILHHNYARKDTEIIAVLLCLTKSNLLTYSCRCLVESRYYFCLLCKYISSSYCWFARSPYPNVIMGMFRTIKFQRIILKTHIKLRRLFIVAINFAWLCVAPNKLKTSTVTFCICLFLQIRANIFIQFCC